MQKIPGSSGTSSFGDARGLTAAVLILFAAAAPATAKVRFGSNVFVGGHNFSHQTFNRRHRAIIKLYDRPIRNQGCVTRSDGHSGTVKSCRLQQIRR